jgi:hypothetical protein
MGLAPKAARHRADEVLEFFRLSDKAMEQRLLKCR